MIEVQTRSLVEQLTDIYQNFESWHVHKLSIEASKDYFYKMLEKGAIIVYEELGIVLGYVEVYRVNFEQWGRIVCRLPFNACKENISDGNIAYVANTWIDPKFRSSSVYKTLKYMFFKQNFRCEYYVGIALRKKTQPIKVFSKSQLVSKLFTEGKNGLE